LCSGVGCTVIALMLIFSMPQKVYAQAVIAVPTNDAANLLVNTAASKALVGLFAKENIFDGILVELGKQLIRHMTESIVTWIDGGFKGSPKFVSNPEAFFTDLADQATGLFIDRLGAGFLCQQFDFSIRYALQLDFNYGGRGGYLDRYACTASAVIDNISSGEIVDLGAFFDVAVTTSNNPYGAYVAAKQELTTQIFSQTQVQRDMLNWGNGFLSIRDKNGNITTPGNVIEGQLSNVLGSDLRQLELADEINEIIGALANQLITQVIDVGVSGLSIGSSSGSGQKPIDTYKDIGNTSGKTTNLNNQINTALTNGRSNIASGLDQNNQYVDTGSIANPQQAVPQRFNIAMQGTASQSSTYSNYVASGAIDGSKARISNYHNAAAFPHVNYTGEHWWQLDLGKEYPINEINFYRYLTGGANKIFIFVSKKPMKELTLEGDVFLRFYMNTLQRGQYYFLLTTAQTDINNPKYAGIQAIYPRSQIIGGQEAYDTFSISRDLETISFDTSPVGRYITVFQLRTESAGVWIHELEVYPNNAPLLSLEGQARITLSKEDAVFTDPGIIVRDTEDTTFALHNATARLTTESGELLREYAMDAIQPITFTEVGTYTITYTATDSGGVGGIPIKRTIIVQ